MASKKKVMGYSAPADTTHLLDLLDGSKPLLKKFQGTLGLCLAESSRNCRTSVTATSVSRQHVESLHHVLKLLWLHA